MRANYIILRVVYGNDIQHRSSGGYDISLFLEGNFRMLDHLDDAVGHQHLTRLGVTVRHGKIVRKVSVNMNKATRSCNAIMDEIQH